MLRDVDTHRKSAGLVHSDVTQYRKRVQICQDLHPSAAECDKDDLSLDLRAPNSLSQTTIVEAEPVRGEHYRCGGDAVPEDGAEANSGITRQKEEHMRKKHSRSRITHV